MTCVEGSKSGLFVLKTHPKGWELTMLWSPQDPCSARVPVSDGFDPAWVTRKIGLEP